MTHRTHLLAIVAALFLPPALATARQPEPAPAAPTAPSPAEHLKNWQEDLDFLTQEFPKLHKNAFFKCPKEQWLARAADIRARIADLTDAQLTVEVRRLVAMIGDGHSQVWINADSKVPQQQAYPLAFIWLADGIFAPVVPKEHEALIGQKLVRIGETPIDQAAARVAEVRAAENESGRRHQVGQDLRDVATLNTLGLVKDTEHADFTFADSAGKETTITLAPVPLMADWTRIVIQRPDPNLAEGWRSFKRFPYGSQLLTDSRTFYIWYDTCNNQKDKSVIQFSEETLKALDEELAKQPASIDRVVVDFRRNGGGASLLFAPMIQGLATREFVKQKGHLFALIGRRTFSSGMMNAYQLRNATRGACLLVGEPTGGSPNAYGEVKTFPLPNSKLSVQYSTKLFRGVSEDTDAIYPDISVEVDSKAYFENRDVVLEKVIEYKPQ